MTVLSANEIAAAANAAGWPTAQIPTAVAVALAESSGRTDVVNSLGCYGLWQIRKSAHPELFSRYRWDDPTGNASMALSVWRSSNGSWSPWTTHTSGAYLAFLPRAKRAAGNPVAPTVNNIGTVVSSNGITTSLSSLGRRIGFGALGIVFIMLGVYMLNSKPINKFTSSVKTVAEVAAL